MLYHVVLIYTLTIYAHCIVMVTYQEIRSITAPLEYIAIKDMDGIWLPNTNYVQHNGIYRMEYRYAKEDISLLDTVKMLIPLFPPLTRIDIIGLGSKKQTHMRGCCTITIS